MGELDVEHRAVVRGGDDVREILGVHATEIDVGEQWLAGDLVAEADEDGVEAVAGERRTRP